MAGSVKKSTVSGTSATPKKQAIVAGALRVFASNGYTRASIDTIAEVAGASTRTIYNHFGDKAGLFEEVIRTNAESVAESQIALIDRYLVEITDLEGDLVNFATAWAGRDAKGQKDHFDLVRHIGADVEHIPTKALKAWQNAGPRRVRRELAKRFRTMSDRGLLVIADPERAVVHFIRLITIEDSPYVASAKPTRRQVEDAVVAGVRVFLYGYEARR